VHSAIAVLFATLTASLFCTGILAAYALRVARTGRASSPRLGAFPGTVLFPAWLIEAFHWALHAPANFLARLGVTPDTLTFGALALSLASAPILAVGWMSIGALVVLAAAAFDGLDGMVARAQKSASPSGAVLDSFVDRIADAAPLAGLVVFYRERISTLIVALAAMTASSLVSYARAKADIYALALPQGIMRRHERVAYLVASLLLAPAAPTLRLTGSAPYPIALAGLSMIAIAGSLASLLLVSRTRRALDRASLRKRTPKPARSSDLARAPESCVEDEI
jgi:CDP-diacylglycerol--glycerol-3-phosphate 3-phosphatidyltransferase